MKETKYVLCDCCGSKIYLGSEMYCSGGYWDCTVSGDDNYCKNGDNLNINWEIACEEYGIETV